MAPFLLGFLFIVLCLLNDTYEKNLANPERLPAPAAIPGQQGPVQKWPYQGLPVPRRIPGHGDGLHVRQGEQHHGPHLFRSGGCPGLRLQRTSHTMAGQSASQSSRRKILVP
ncbi:unnamed protein product [Larinioides sclopetarius]|uniref:Uncharacterized protein n=1 Tax=Larinioides sclopetarius TaxID=280406 RepID=A0AAV2BHW2_9ARAC